MNNTKLNRVSCLTDIALVAGRHRLNASLIVQGCLISYAALWISFICVVYLHGGVGIPASKTFGFLVFLPLSFSGAHPFSLRWRAPTEGLTRSRCAS